MKTTMYILSAVVLMLLVVAGILWFLPEDNGNRVVSETRYGLNEGMQLVEQSMMSGDKQYVVENVEENILFRISLRGCMLDTRFRNGKLRFRELLTGREGFMDSRGIVTFADNSNMTRQKVNVEENKNPDISNLSASDNEPVCSASKGSGNTNLPQTDIRKLAHGSPFYDEAAKILQGHLTESDAASRRQILNYCEHLRTAYTTKDIDFLRQVFSDKALIIVGNVVRTAKEQSGVEVDSRVSYALHTKRDYLARLQKVFAVNKSVNVQFSDFRIMRHPSKKGIYGVILRQRYRSDRYADDGWLFLLWDFRNAAMPLIHVRTWQPSSTVGSVDDVIELSDFNLE